jgi:hypothetical protein
MEQEETKEQLSQPVVVEGNWQPASFCDLILIEGTPESVLLSFMQKSSGTSLSQQESRFTPVAKVALSLPHFFRLASHLNAVAASKHQSVVKHLEHQIEQFRRSTHPEDPARSE